MLKLNPYAAVTKRKAILATKKRLLEKVLADAKKSGVSIFYYNWIVQFYDETFRALGYEFL